MAKITGFTIAKEAPRRGRRLLGEFDCELPGVELNGCRLWQLKNGNTFIHPPGVGPRTQQHAIIITDSAIRAEMHDAAMRAFQALGGSLDWPVQERAHG